MRLVLEELISSLDFQYADIADGFNRLYTYCLEQTAEDAFDRVQFILQDLRDTAHERARRDGRDHVGRAHQGTQDRRRVMPVRGAAPSGVDGAVRERYRQCPYPPRDAAGEHRGLPQTWLGNLARVNGLPWGGRRDVNRLRVLDAVAGTGDGPPISSTSTRRRRA